MSSYSMDPLVTSRISSVISSATTPTQAAVKIESVSGDDKNGMTSPANSSRLMIDSQDEFSDDDDHMDVWRSTERRSSLIVDGDACDGEEDLGISMENKNTQRKTDTDIRIFITYLRSINEFRAPELIPPNHLDGYLSAFFSVVKKHDGNEYEPASLRGMLCSVERYLKLKNYPQSVTRDSAFTNTRNALKFKQQKLRELGKGSKKQPEPFGRLTLDKVNHLFGAREMGPYTPMSVVNTLCFLFIVHFRLRKAIDHKNLIWGDIKLKTDPSGRKFLIYEPVDVQNSIAHSKYDHHGNRLCIWEQPEVKERDPIAIYNLYWEKRPQNMRYDNSPFYLGITSMQPSPLQAWYRTCAMGVNKLSDLVRMIRDITGLPRATMNGPTEYILSESYGMVSSNPRHDRPLSSVALMPDTKHSGLFALHSAATTNGGVKNEIDYDTDNQSNFSSEVGNRNSESYGPETSVDEDDDTNDRADLLQGTSSPDDPEQADGEKKIGSLSLKDAKSKIGEILSCMDENDQTVLRKWMVSVMADNKNDFDLDNDKTCTLDQQLSFPTISLNIKITPEALTGSSPVTVEAAVQPTLNTKNKIDGKTSDTKRKADTTDSDGLAKRLKDDLSKPVNLTSDSSLKLTDTLFRSTEKFKNLKRTTGSVNTAVVLPRSDRNDILKTLVTSNVGTELSSCTSPKAHLTSGGGGDSSICTSKKPSSNVGIENTSNTSLKTLVSSSAADDSSYSSNKTKTFQSKNIGYLVPTSYPYLNPNCFAQDPRLLMTAANIIPQMAASGVSASFPYLQSSFRSIAPKTTSQSKD